MRIRRTWPNSVTRLPNRTRFSAWVTVSKKQCSDIPIAQKPRLNLPTLIVLRAASNASTPVWRTSSARTG